MVYNTYYSAKNQYYIVNAFPMKSVMNDVYTLQGGMVGLLLLLLFLAIVLNVLVSKFFWEKNQADYRHNGAGEGRESYFISYSAQL